MAKHLQQGKNFNDLMEKCRTFLDQHPQEQDEVALGILMNSLAGRDASEAMNVMSMLLAQFCIATSNTFEVDVRSVLLGVMTDAAEDINVLEAEAFEAEELEYALEAKAEFDATYTPSKKSTVH